MFDFRKLKIVKVENDSSYNPFVGIKRDEDGLLTFCLPLGFKDFPEDSFNETKNLFFRMYRTFNKFHQENKNNFKDIKPRERDNVEVPDNAYHFKDKEGNDVIVYSKISLIERIFKVFNDLSLNTLSCRNKSTDTVDFSKIDRYLHKGVYLEDDTIFIDRMNNTVRVMDYNSSDLVEMFCFILYEIKKELEEEGSLDIRVLEYYNNFKEKHLSYDQSLFSEETFEQTVILLKEILNDINIYTVYKDHDYWAMYSAIENFLYGELDMESPQEDGIYWGINNFAQIWEDMCNTYAFSQYNVLYSDTKISFEQKDLTIKNIGGHNVYCKNDFEPPFYLELSGNRRWMRPDFISVENEIKYKGFEVDIIEDDAHSNTINFMIRRKPTLSHLGLDLGASNYDKVIIAFNKFSRKNKSLKIKKKEMRIGFVFSGFPEKVFFKILNVFSKKKISLKVFDWKYIDKRLIVSESEKVRKDVTKQVAYYFCLHHYYQRKRVDFEVVNNSFVIPSYINSADKVFRETFSEYDKPELLKKKGITVIDADFHTIQRAYIENENGNWAS